MSGWDDIDIKASDILDGYVATHPVQMIMAADRVVQVDKKVQYCVHPSRQRLMAHNPRLLLRPDTLYVVVHLGSYGICNLPYKDVTAPGTDGLMPLRAVYWLMGLCECGTLYWMPDGERHYVVTL